MPDYNQTRRTPTRRSIEEGRQGLAFGAALCVLAALIGLCVLLERVGLPAALVESMVGALVLGLVITAALGGRSMTVFDFDLGRQAVPVPGNALAIALLALSLLWLLPDRAIAGSAVVAGILAGALLFGAGWRRGALPTIAAHLRRGEGCSELVLALTSVISALVMLLSAAALMGEAEGVLVHSFGFTRWHAVGLSVAMVAVIAVVGGLRSVSAAQLAAGVCVLVGVGVGTLVWLAELAPAAPPPVAAACPVGEQVWLWLTICCGMMAFPALFPRYASARTPWEARRGGLFGALLAGVLWLSPLLVPPVRHAAPTLGTVAELYAAITVVVGLTAGALCLLVAVRTLSGAAGSGSRADREAPASRRLARTRLLLLGMVMLAGAGPSALGQFSADASGVHATIAGDRLMLWAWSLAAAGLLPVAAFQQVRLPMPKGAAAFGIAAGCLFAALCLAEVPLPSARFPLAGAGVVGAIVGIIVMAGWTVLSAMHASALAPDSRKPRGPGGSGGQGSAGAALPEASRTARAVQQ